MLAVMLLAGCTEAQFVSHVAKRIPMPGDLPEGQGTFKVGRPYKIAGRTYYPRESYDHSETGIASWYGPNFHGKPTANGEIFDKRELTAAHRTLQLPSIVRVTNLENGRSLVVRVNDRGPFARGRIIDLSEASAELLGFKLQGTARVRIDVLPYESRKVAEAARRGIDTAGMEVAMNRRQGPADARPARTMPASLPPDPAVQPATARPAAFESVVSELAEMAPGHVKRGVYLPDPVVKEGNAVATSLFVQAGAFSDRRNADRLALRLRRVERAHVMPGTSGGAPIYRVRLGPLESVALADDILNRVIGLGHDDAMIVVD